MIPAHSVPHDTIPFNEPATSDHRAEVTPQDLARSERLAILLRNGYRPTEESNDEMSSPLDVESYAQSAPPANEETAA